MCSIQQRERERERETMAEKQEEPISISRLEKRETRNEKRVRLLLDFFNLLVHLDGNRQSRAFAQSIGSFHWTEFDSLSPYETRFQWKLRRRKNNNSKRVTKTIESATCARFSRATLSWLRIFLNTLGCVSLSLSVCSLQPLLTISRARKFE